MSKKTEKTEKVVIAWPENHFTINDVQKTVPNMINITLRFRIKRAVETKVIKAIGKIKPAIGRPMLVFAKCPVDESVIAKAREAGVLPLETESKPTKVKVAEVKSVSTETQSESSADVTVEQSATSNVAVTA